MCAEYRGYVYRFSTIAAIPVLCYQRPNAPLCERGQALFVMSLNCLHLRRFSESANPMRRAACCLCTWFVHKFCAAGFVTESRCPVKGFFVKRCNFDKKSPSFGLLGPMGESRVVSRWVARKSVFCRGIRENSGVDESFLCLGSSLQERIGRT